VVFGPRCGSKTEHFQIPAGLAPGALRGLLGVVVTRVESLAPELNEPLEWQGRRYEARLWREHLEAPAEAVQARFGDGRPALVSQGRFHYLGCVAQEGFLVDWLEVLARRAGLEPLRLPEGVRLRRRGGLTFAFNLGAEPWRVPVPGARFVLGEGVVPPHQVSAWR
jgi:beta-galactosidase